MIDKILRLQIAFLSTLAILAFIAYYYQENLVNNYLTITSKQEFSHIFLNNILYYLTSIPVAVGHLTGPWIFISFAIFIPFFVFGYGKRESWIDLLNVFWLVGAIVGISVVFSPSLVGEGLIHLIWLALSPAQAVVIGIVSAIAFFAGSFRSKFFKTCRFVMVKTSLGALWILSLKFLSAKKAISPIVPSTPSLEKSKEPSPSSPSLESSRDAEESKSLCPLVVSPPPYHDLTTLPVKDPPAKVNVPDNTYFEGITKRLEEKLQEFKIEGRIIDVLKGPVVDTFELELGAGVKISRLISVNEDLGLALQGVPIRIVYPMKGHSTVGIEIPRTPRDLIYLDDILKTDEFKDSGGHLPMVMGKDVFGKVLVEDLASMPHMLVAGATGAGKSVFLNSLLISLLVKKPPEEMKLILIDPKQLELALYARLPHLIMPVLTEGKHASTALRWGCREMERRYNILKEFGVRNIEGFNEKLKNADKGLLDAISPYYSDDNFKLPYLLIVVDEFADLVLTRTGREIENNLCRLAAKARAAGIHLVIATQRPSVDVITGLIKSNFPTRVSFRVSTNVDSRTILNAQGAEKLLGRGDMLFKHGVDTLRVHSALVTEKETGLLIDKLSKLPQSFDKEALDFLKVGGESPDSGPDNTTDSKYSQALEIVSRYGTASASLLQRRLGIGYNRAANLIEIMEKKGVVGPNQGSKPRKVLISSAHSH